MANIRDNSEEAGSWKPEVRSWEYRNLVICWVGGVIGLSGCSCCQVVVVVGGWVAFFFGIRDAFLDAGYWVLDTGCWILDAGYWILDAGWWMLDTGYWILDAGCWMVDSKL